MMTREIGAKNSSQGIGAVYNVEVQNPIIQIKNLDVSYSDGTESLRDVSLDIEQNAITVLFGPSGGGKSTLLRTLNRLNDLADVKQVSGEVLLHGENILDSQTDVIALRRKVGMVFSRPLPLPLSIYKNVSYALETAGIRSRCRLDEAVEHALRQAILWDEVHDRLEDSASTLSGGQKQRLCLARSLAFEPEIILLDEPTSALDPVATMRIEELLYELKKEFTIILVPHVMQQAARTADFAAFFLSGELVEFNSGEKLFTLPEDDRTQEYITGRFG
jgi:phosphate transport system ATP-binding protein